MKIYVVNYNWDYEETDTIGTYSTLEGAKKSIEKEIERLYNNNGYKIENFNIEILEDNSYHIYRKEENGRETWYGTFYIEESFLED